ncbi:single-stranded DNA-binding protein [Leucobacter ruminantium]|uniref:Single-stranded DNA-binding protein n=1 Tax=Leucobacter ruminantium TaxID=1289170 RepID=A0A939LU84_9MICO|nr:single-stranded DNA-binding protein [Leucobacter ruminantium]MBO1804461.1 single-stranded DNA-binding protein [Leucobacter ruminantium]
MRVEQAVKGFIVRQVHEGKTKKQQDMLVLRAGQDEFAPGPDGTRQKTGTEYFNLLFFGKAAQVAKEKYRPGDRFIGGGYEKQPRTWTRQDGTEEVVREFVVRHPGHNMLESQYSVHREAAQKEAGPSALQRETMAADPVDVAGAEHEVGAPSEASPEARTTESVTGPADVRSSPHLEDPERSPAVSGVQQPGADQSSAAAGWDHVFEPEPANRRL